MPKQTKELKFEEAVEKLEGFIHQLEAGEVPLEESLKIFEEGIALSKWCETRLTEVEGRIETLMKKGVQQGSPLDNPEEETP